MKNRFKIGEISKLHQIPVKTLRYYDSVDLFKPAVVDPVSNYRYYTIEQFEMLNSIKFLRHLGYSIKDIKSHLRSRAEDGFIDSLKSYKKTAEFEIRQLNKIKKFLTERISEIETVLKDRPLNEVLLRTIPDRKIVTLKTRIENVFDLELNLRELENRSKLMPSIMIGRVGLTISKGNILLNKFDEYNSIFILNSINSPAEKKYKAVLSSGTYACIYFNAGNHAKSHQFYKKLLDYLREHNLTICGDAIERVIIDNFITSDPDKHITEIQIPIRS